MTRDLRTRRTRRGRRGRPDRMFVARRAVFSLVLFGILLAASVGAVLAGVDGPPDHAGPAGCPSASAGTRSCPPAPPAAVPANARR